jgi:hypothetical protein
MYTSELKRIHDAYMIKKIILYDIIFLIDVLFPLVGWWIEGFVYPFNNRSMMIDGIPNRPLFFSKRTLLVPYVSNVEIYQNGKDMGHSIP